MSKHGKLKLTSVTALSLTLLQLPLAEAARAARLQSQKGASSSMTMTNPLQSPLACNARALSPAQKLRIRALLNEFRATDHDVKELASGYSIRLSGDDRTIREAAEYISLERLCCPFFDFALSAEREAGPVWLTLTGREGVKEFARIEFGIQKPMGYSAAEATTPRESPLVCNDGALSPAQSAKLADVVTEFREQKQEIREFPDGYAVRLPASSEIVQDVAAFMTIVRRCSPYFDTTLQVQCEAGPVWLKITGRKGVKELVRMEFRI